MTRITSGCAAVDVSIELFRDRQQIPPLASFALTSVPPTDSVVPTCNHSSKLSSAGKY
jgi:hypothetical protein